MSNRLLVRIKEEKKEGRREEGEREEKGGRESEYMNAD